MQVRVMLIAILLLTASFANAKATSCTNQPNLHAGLYVPQNKQNQFCMLTIAQSDDLIVINIEQLKYRDRSGSYHGSQGNCSDNGRTVFRRIAGTSGIYKSEDGRVGFLMKTMGENGLLIGFDVKSLDAGQGDVYILN